MPNQQLNEINVETMPEAEYKTPTGKGFNFKPIIFSVLGIFIFAGLAYGGWYGYNYLFVPKLKNLLLESAQKIEDLKTVRMEYEMNVEFEMPDDIKTTKQASLGMLSEVFGQQQDMVFVTKGYGLFDKTDQTNVKTETKLEVSGGTAFGKLGAIFKSLDQAFYFQLTDIPAIASAFIDPSKVKNKWIKIDLQKEDKLFEKYKDEYQTDKVEFEQNLKNFKQAFTEADIINETQKCKAETINNSKSITCQFKIKGPGLKDLVYRYQELSGKDKSKLDELKPEDWEKMNQFLDHLLINVSFTNDEHYLKSLTILLDGGNLQLQDNPIKKFAAEIRFSDFNQDQKITAPDSSMSFEELLSGLMSSIMGGALESSREASRDAKRISDIKQTQTALELYYVDNNHYPVVKDKVVLGQGDYICLNQDGFKSTSGCTKSVYMGNIPSNPTPGGIDYTYSSQDGQKYVIEFALGEDTAGFKAGLQQATPNGIESVEQTTSDSINNYFDKDSDQDGLPDIEEGVYGTNPNNADTDGDGYLDGEEVKNGYNPNGSGKSLL